MSNRALLVWGLLLAWFGRMAHEFVLEFAGLADWHGRQSVFSDAAVLMRQQLSLAGDYPGLVRAFAEITLVDWLLNGFIFGWILYALGRFMLGAYVGRRGWLQNAQLHLSGFRRWMRIALPAGLILEGMATIMAHDEHGELLPAWDHWGFVADALHLLAVPVLAAGYLCAIVVGLHAPSWRRRLRPFGYAGRMALSNYIGQSFFYALVLFGVGPGLALAGKIGATALIVIATVAFAGQVLLSRWWLARFRYGPLEWLWRGLTYGRWPAMLAA
jgi:uncharacterized protein